MLRISEVYRYSRPRVGVCRYRLYPLSLGSVGCKGSCVGGYGLPQAAPRIDGHPATAHQEFLVLSSDIG
jgi:hypothetical protein